MAVWKYAPVAADEGAVPAARGGSDGPRRRGSNSDEEVHKRMPYCVGACVLISIVYVLSRTGAAQTACNDAASAVMLQDGTFDIGAYRKSQLSLTPPNIIECVEAGEGGDQSACHLPREERFSALGQKGVTLWMTGLSGSGKSTIARALETELVSHRGKHVQQLDGDNVRTGLNRDLGFSAADRAESVRRVGEMACLFNGGGVITLVTLVSPYREDRDEARRRHEEQGLTFIEVFLDVPLTVVQDRDPKGLYKKVEAGELKHFTGVDDPYEEPLHPEVRLPNHEMTVDECVQALMAAMRERGVLEGGPTDGAHGLPIPSGYNGTWLEDQLLVPSHLASQRLSEAQMLPKVLLTDIDLNWLQVLGEGWAAPMRGFMREGALLQALHFNSVVIDPFNATGAQDVEASTTDWDADTRGRQRVSMSVPIVLPITGYTKALLEANGGATSAALTTKDGKIVAILRAPEVYAFRKEEVIARCFGVIDPGHPYIAHLNAAGDWLVGGEIELLDRIRYNDGLDQWRLTPKEIFHEFQAKGADVAFAFQTRNPTHAGHAYLMNVGRERMLAKGYKNPILLLSPLGGWTKSDDVPLDVRVKQHQAILDERMLDPATTVLAIWPAPMIYAGPTEVQFHAVSRRNAGASFFVVGRDAAGMKGSMEAEASPDDDLYASEHARYALLQSPVLEDGNMQLLSFDKFMYDKTDHQMKMPVQSRIDDFISISGSKMRALAKQGATPCADPIPSDLLAANCVPQGFMVSKGWAIVCDYYQHIDSGTWIPWSRPVVNAPSAAQSVAEGQYGTPGYSLFFTRDGARISPWHDLPLRPSGSASGSTEYTFVVEIPMFGTAKMEVMKEERHNPIKQDTNKDGSMRYYTYGVPFFNYGLIPQTWEDPSVLDSQGHGGDNDPLDVIEVGSVSLEMGTVTSIKVLGSLELIDEGETDHKIIGITTHDPDAWRINDMATLEAAKPGITAKLVDWLKMYKTSDGKGVNSLANGERALAVPDAVRVIEECHQRWVALTDPADGAAPNRDGFWLDP